MNSLLFAELCVGLFSVLGAGIVILVMTDRTPKALDAEIASRVERSITVLGDLQDPR